MVTSTRTCTALFCGWVLLAAGAAGGEQPATGQHPGTVASHEQTRDGVTVRIEKIAREHVFNSVAWLRKQYGQNWQKEVPLDFTPEPFQVVRVFVSITTAETETGPIKKTGGSLKLGKKLSNGQSKWGPLISASFDPPLWQRELPDLKVDPEARGAIFLKVVHGDTRIEDLSPAELRFQVTTSEGKEVEFLFFLCFAADCQSHMVSRTRRRKDAKMDHDPCALAPSRDSSASVACVAAGCETPGDRPMTLWARELPHVTWDSGYG